MRILRVIPRWGRIQGESVWVGRPRLWEAFLCLEKQARCVIWLPGGYLIWDLEPVSVLATLNRKIYAPYHQTIGV